MEQIKPILPQEFIEKLQTKQNSNKIDFKAYFKPYIDQIITHTVGPFCWFIPDNRAMKIVSASDNIAQLTPFAKAKWIGQGPAFLASIVHPDDSYYFLAATSLSAELYENRPIETREKLRVNIYCRMLDATRNYRWTLIQFVARYYNEQGRIESTLAVMTDLSSFDMVKKPMMTVIDNNNKEHQYFKVIANNKKLEPLSIPHITKREQEIVNQMIKGLNTPQIAASLNISYHTVENHKRNLRKKTATKTSAELVYLMKSNCLI